MSVPRPDIRFDRFIDGSPSSGARGREQALAPEFPTPALAWTVDRRHDASLDNAGYATKPSVCECLQLFHDHAS